MDVLPFDDPDGLRIELIGNSMRSNTKPWIEGPVDARFALQGFHSATLWLDEVEPTAEVLTKLMGFNFIGQEGNRYRFSGDGSTLGSNIDILHLPGNEQAIFGAGAIHHVAFRVPDDLTQLDYRQSLKAAGLGVTGVRDRSYFHSIYFREPGGVLFEIATNTPGFATDEPSEKLGEALKLPVWLEEQRAEIENILVPLTLKPVQKAENERQN
jgi:glyoxalase family protein